jgi:hypothetical protein
VAHNPQLGVAPQRSSQTLPVLSLNAIYDRALSNKKNGGSRVTSDIVTPAEALSLGCCSGGRYRFDAPALPQNRYMMEAALVLLGMLLAVGLIVGLASCLDLEG